MIVCPKCKGKGEHSDYDIGLGIPTLGLTVVIDSFFKQTCNVCKGSGVVRECPGVRMKGR